MPSTSHNQQLFMRMVKLLKAGKMPMSKASPSMKKAASSMSSHDVAEFAKSRKPGR